MATNIESQQLPPPILTPSPAEEKLAVGNWLTGTTGVLFTLAWVVWCNLVVMGCARVLRPLLKRRVMRVYQH